MVRREELCDQGCIVGQGGVAQVRGDVDQTVDVAFVCALLGGDPRCFQEADIAHGGRWCFWC